MDEKMIERINELARKKKETGLTEAEAKEQHELRQAYLDAIRANLRGSLETMKIQEPDGTIIDVKKRHEEKMSREADENAEEQSGS